jgi:two-component system sensor histidine kinase PilS (NtrC family)
VGKTASHRKEMRTFLRKMIIARLAIITVFLITGILVFFDTGAGEMVVPLLLLLGVTYFFSLLYTILLRYSSSLKFHYFLQIFVDLVIETYLICITGGYQSPFSFFYLLSIIGSCFSFPYAGIATAGFAGTIFALVLHLQYYGIVSIPPVVTGEEWSLGDLYGQIYTHFTLFFFAGLIGDYFSRMLKQHRQDLNRTKDLLMKAHLDKDDILKNVSSGLMTVDRHGTVIYFNQMAESILEIKAEEVIDHTYGEAFGARLAQFTMKMNEAIDSGTDKIRSELEITCASGAKKPIGISITLLHDEDDEKRGAIALFQDLTDVKKMDEEMRKKDLMAVIGELSAGIAHEIRNPLASISGSVEILKEESCLTDKNNNLLNLIIKESERLDAIISNFLDFARIKPMNPGRVKVEDTLDEVLLLVKNHSAYNSRISIVKNYHGNGDRCIYADEDQIKQVFLNLAINAIQAMEDGGCLTLSVGHPDGAGATASEKDGSNGKIAVCFSDTGCGIEERYRAKIFEPFFTTKASGTGLGLAMVQRIIESHRGEILVQSGPPGDGGTAITLMLPSAR